MKKGKWCHSVFGQIKMQEEFKDTETCKKYSVTVIFLLYISYKTTIFQNIIPVNSCSILMKFLPTEASTYVVFCDYFKIFFGSTDFKYS
jgi:hypothetical protein